MLALTRGGFNGEAGLATEIQLNNPNGLFAFPNGTIFILDFFNRRVRKVDRAGQLTTLFEDSSGFGPGRALWVSPSEDLVYYNGGSVIKRWTPANGIEVVAEEISDPGNLAVRPNGDLIVTARAAHLVYRISPDGTKTVIAGDGTDKEITGGMLATEAGLESVRGVAIQSDGSFFLATQKGGDVWFVDTSGVIHRFISGNGKGNTRDGENDLVSTPGDKISEPRAISLAPNGDLIITSNDKGYVRVAQRLASPKLVRLEGASLEWVLTPGREHHLESSRDLSKWERLISADTGADVLTWEASGETPKNLWFRVSW